jgi:ribosome maturation factor RimP
VYVDREGGIGLDECAQVSRQLAGVFDVEDPIPGRYVLEVSSPGLDRPLYGPADYQRFAGRRVRLTLVSPLEGQRHFRGVLRGMRGDEVLIEVEGAELTLSHEQIQKARLVPDYET